MWLQEVKFAASVCAAGLLLGGCAELRSASKLADSQPALAKTAAAPSVPTKRLFSVLKDHNGHPVSGITGVMFSIYAEEKSGAPLWMETQNVETNSAGRYLVRLGSIKSEGLPGELFLEGEPRWLGVHILLPGEVERRIPLTAADDRIIVKHEFSFPPDAKKFTEEQSQDSQFTPSENQTAEQDPNASAPDSQMRARRLHHRHVRPH
jgi:hypothetical protein